MELVAIPLVLLGLGVYCLPIFVALARGVGNAARLRIAVATLLLGWTLIGWLVAFGWACATPGKGARREQPHRDGALMAAIARHGP